MAIVERLWAAGFALAGRIIRPRVGGWSSPGGQRILVIAPHPDDEACGCAGTLVRHQRCGDEVCVAHVTDGRRSRAFGLGPEQMARRRRREAEVSAKLLGVDRLEWLGLPEGEWGVEQLRAGLRSLVEQWPPDIVYAPSRIDFHPEHHKVAHALALALSDLLAAPIVRIYQIQVPLTPILTNLVADLSEVIAQVGPALAAYASQVGSVARTLRLRRYGAAFYGLNHPTEEFWELSAGQYIALHAQPERWSLRAFRSLRLYSWSDPLAYLWGMAERRRLDALVATANSEGKTREWNTRILG